MRIILNCQILILFLAAPLPIKAQIDSENPSREDLEAFIDTWMAGKMATHHIPGAVLVMVKDGDFLLARGFGVADLETQLPMDARKTILRVASNSKLFTTTAVMQASEMGQVDLKTDIRAYIEPDLLRAYPTPVNLHQLLTHSAGIGDKFFGQTVAKSEDLIPLQTYLEQELARSLAQPGYFINYSNHGISLAAHAVENVSGLNFEVYCQKNIFTPLGMDNSTFIPSEELMGKAATGYKYILGQHRILPVRHWRPYPASSLVTTGHDMGRFMIAHLENGTLNLAGETSSEIFSEESAKIMHRRQFTMHPRVPGMAYGFWEREMNGKRLLWHSGHMPGHRTGLFLIKSERLGIFLNSNTEFRLFDLFIDDFLDRFYPPPSLELVDSAGGQNLNRYTGAYRHNWYPRRTIGKIVAFHGLQGQQLNVKPAADGQSLLIGGKKFVWMVKNLFREADGDQYAAFWESTRGNPVILYQGGMLTYHRLRWYHRIELHRVLSVLLSAVFIVCLILWIRANKKDGFQSLSRKSLASLQVARISAGLTCVLYLVFLLAMAALLSNGAYKMAQEIQLPLKIALALPLLTGASSAVLFCTLFVSWNLASLSRKEKFLYTAILLNSLAALAFLNYWKLLGYRF